MSAEVLYDAIGDIWEDFILDAEAEGRIIHRSPLRTVIAAVFMLFLLALPVSAEMRTGYVSNLLAPFYGGAQTELVDSIGVPIDASVTIGEYTLTADAVIGDRYNIAIVHSLTRKDGEILPEDIRFDDVDCQWKRKGGGGGYVDFIRSEDGKSLKIIMQWTSGDPIFLLDRKCASVFRNLRIEDELLVEGEWQLKFTIRYEDTTEKLPAGNLHVQGENGLQYEIHQILLSPLGIHIDMTVPNPRIVGYENDVYLTDFTVSVLLANGEEISLENSSKGWGGSMDEEKIKARYGAMFDEPIPMESITSLRICGTVIPIR